MSRDLELPLRPDFTLDQPYDRYTAADHATWASLFARQAALLPGRACKPFLDGLEGLGVAADGIPDFNRLSDLLERASGWRLVAAPGLVPDDVFFTHLSERRFPVTWWIRRPDQIDYIQEPDVFHDVYGHVPLLMNPVFGDYMQAYGAGGVKAMGLGALTNLARLYWYTVEFGLIRTDEGLRIYGAGILSSKGESMYALDDPAPNRVGFDLMRVMRTRYRIDTYQRSYFVIDGFEQLFDATRPDFTPYYEALAAEADIGASSLIEGDQVLHRGVGGALADETPDV